MIAGGDSLVECWVLGVSVKQEQGKRRQGWRLRIDVFVCPVQREGGKLEAVTRRDHHKAGVFKSVPPRDQ
jgi:hypothetical protein